MKPLYVPTEIRHGLIKKKVKQLVIAKQNTYKFYTENKKDPEIFNRS